MSNSAQISTFWFKYVRDPHLTPHHEGLLVVGGKMRRELGEEGRKDVANKIMMGKEMRRRRNGFEKGAWGRRGGRMLQIELI